MKINPVMMTSGVNLENILVNVASSVLAADVAIKLLESQGVGIIICITACVILIFGEILPKTYCNANPEKAFENTIDDKIKVKMDQTDKN